MESHKKKILELQMEEFIQQFLVLRSLNAALLTTFLDGETMLCSEDLENFCIHLNDCLKTLEGSLMGLEDTFLKHLDFINV